MKAFFSADIDFKETSRTFNGMSLSVPSLTQSVTSDLAKALLEAQTTVQRIGISDIVTAIAETTKLWTKPSFPPRQTAEKWLPTLTGFSQPMVAWALNTCFSSLTADALNALLRSELGDPKVLDNFQLKRHGGDSHQAFGPHLITHILSGNIIGIAVNSIIFGLLTKSANIAKSASQEPLLGPLFAESLQPIFPELARCIAVLWWKSGDKKIETEMFAHSNVVVAYGRDKTIQNIKRDLPPHVRLVEHGHRLSFGIVGREQVTAEVAQSAARDVCLFDQKGCLSLQAIYVEEGGAATSQQFATWLSYAMPSLCSKFPPGPITKSEAAFVQNFRATYETMGGTVYAPSHSLDWTVIHDPDSKLRPSCLHRTILVKPIDDLRCVPDAVRPLGGKLSAVGIAAPPERIGNIARPLANLGANRLCPIGHMQEPPLTWHHDGRFNLLDLIHFTDLEN